MTSPGLRQRLLATFSADAVGYSRLMADDELATIAALDSARTAFRNRIEIDQGRVVDMAGDSVLAVFETATGAVTAALAIQRDLVASCEVLPEHRQMRFRIGIHLGDISEKADGTVYGDGVNISARLQALADAGGIVVSQAIYGAVRGKLTAHFLDLGEQQLKHSPYPVRAFEVRAAHSVGAASGSERIPAGPSPPALPSLAVSAFTNMRGDSEQENRIAENIVSAIERSVVGRRALSTSCVFGRFEIRPGQRDVLIDGKPTEIGARAFDVLMALVERRERTVPKSELLDVVWPGLIVEENNLQAQVSAIRKLLGRNAVATIPGIGYRFTLAAAASTDGEPSAARSDPTSPMAPRTNVPQPAQPLTGREADVVALEASARTNVPAASDILIGRDPDVTELSRFVSEHRLVTLVGAGGIGKTRVAQAVAREVARAFPHGVWWVDLGALSSGDKIAAGIAIAAKVPLGDGDAQALLVRALAPRELLLVLDNCEHLAADIASVVDVVLAGAPGVKILATSRVALKSSGEYLYSLPTLEVPPVETSLACACTFSAVRLLEHRAKAVDRRFALTEGNVGQAIDVCQQLDGLALAIEMAAARIPFLGLTGLQQRLGDRLNLLRAPSHAAPSRQETLRATLDWSYSLLTTNEQVVLRRLAAFVGSFRLEAAQHVAASTELDEWAVLEAMAGLVDKSLLKLEQLEPPRYRLIATTRLYAWERLESSDEAAVALRHHCQSMAQLAQEAEELFQEESEADWLLRYAPDYDDLSEAFDRARQRQDADVAAAISITLRFLDQTRGMLVNSSPRVAAAYAMLPHASTLAQARLCTFIVSCWWIAAGNTSRLDIARKGVELWRAISAERELHRALWGFAGELARVGAFEDAENALDEARRMEDPAWPARLRAMRASYDGYVGALRGDARRHYDRMREARILFEQAGCPRLAARALDGQADAAQMAGEMDKAIALGCEAVDELAKLDQPAQLGSALANLCERLTLVGDFEGARARAAQALPLLEQGGSIFELLNPLALLVALTGRHESAAVLLGYDDAWHTANRIPRDQDELRLAEKADAAIETAIGKAEHARLSAIGASMSSTQLSALLHQLIADEAVLGLREPWSA